MNETGFLCERIQAYVKTGISEMRDEWREVSSLCEDSAGKIISENMVLIHNIFS